MDNAANLKLKCAECRLDKAPHMSAAKYLEMQAMLDMRPTLNKKQAMELLDIEHSTMGKLLKAGEIPTRYYAHGRLQLLTPEVWAHKIAQARKGKDGDRRIITRKRIGGGAKSEGRTENNVTATTPQETTKTGAIFRYVAAAGLSKWVEPVE